MTAKHQNAPAPAGNAGSSACTSLASGLPVNLRDALTGLDEHNLTLAISAFMHASGRRPPHLEP